MDEAVSNQIEDGLSTFQMKNLKNKMQKQGLIAESR